MSLLDCFFHFIIVISDAISSILLLIISAHDNQRPPGKRITNTHTL